MIFAGSKSGDHSRIQGGDLTLTNEAIAGNAEYTLQIPLDRSDYQQGSIMFYDKSTTRRGSTIIFSTDLNGAIASSYTKGTNVISICTFTYHYNRYYLYETDAKLSDAYFSTAGNVVRIKSCQIVGSNIELVFKNTHASLLRHITLEGRFHVER